MASKSRAKRLSEIENVVTGTISDIEELKDELQNWLDNMSENLRNGNKASELEEAISMLEEIISNIESIDWSVNFPGMFG